MSQTTPALQNSSFSVHALQDLTEKENQIKKKKKSFSFTVKAHRTVFRWMKFVIYIIHTEEQLVRIYCNPPWCCGKKKLWTRTDRIIWFGLYKDDIFLLLHFWRKTIFFWDMIPSWVASYSFRRIPMLFYCTQCIMCRCTVFIPFFTSNCYSVLVVNFPLRHWRLGVLTQMIIAQQWILLRSAVAFWTKHLQAAELGTCAPLTAPPSQWHNEKKANYCHTFEDPAQHTPQHPYTHNVSQ